MFSRNYLPKILSVGLGWVIYENVVFNGVVNRFRLFTKAIQRYSEVYKKNEGNFLHFT